MTFLLVRSLALVPLAGANVGLKTLENVENMLQV